MVRPRSRRPAQSIYWRAHPAQTERRLRQDAATDGTGRIVCFMHAADGRCIYLTAVRVHCGGRRRDHRRDPANQRRHLQRFEWDRRDSRAADARSHRMTLLSLGAMRASMAEGTGARVHAAGFTLPNVGSSGTKRPGRNWPAALTRVDDNKMGRSLSPAPRTAASAHRRPRQGHWATVGGMR